MSRKPGAPQIASMLIRLRLSPNLSPNGSTGFVGARLNRLIICGRDRAEDSFDLLCVALPILPTIRRALGFLSLFTFMRFVG